MAVRLAGKGLLPEPLHFNLVMGVNGGISATARDLAFLVDSLPEGATWCATGVGRSAFALAAVAITMGGHVRVGFEDNVYLEKGVVWLQATANWWPRWSSWPNCWAEKIATPAEARKILYLDQKTENGGK